MASVVRALISYLFLVFVVRIVGRRPGKQLTPFEFVLVFFMGGLALTATVGDEASLTNALLQILVIGLAHTLLAWARTKSSRFARMVDGTAMTLLEDGRWRSETMRRMHLKDDDVLASARDMGVKNLDNVKLAVLERNGQISVMENEDDGGGKDGE